MNYDTAVPLKNILLYTDSNIAGINRWFYKARHESVTSSWDTQWTDLHGCRKCRYCRSKYLPSVGLAPASDRHGRWKCRFCRSKKPALRVTVSASSYRPISLAVNGTAVINFIYYNYLTIKRASINRAMKPLYLLLQLVSLCQLSYPTIS